MQAGKTGTLLYNRDAGPLRGANGLMVHMGFDGWYLSVRCAVCPGRTWHIAFLRVPGRVSFGISCGRKESRCLCVSPGR